MKDYVRLGLPLVKFVQVLAMPSGDLIALDAEGQLWRYYGAWEPIPSPEPIPYA